MTAPRAGAGTIQRLERWIACCSEVPAAILVAAEVLLLLLNVVFRYCLHQGLTWADELSSLLFLWLTMLGAVIALRKGQHMRLDIALAGMAPARRRFVATLGDMALLLFVALLARPAWQYVIEEGAITTPALEISHGYRVAAVAVGVTLMLALALLRLLSSARLADALLAALLLAAVAGLIHAGHAQLVALGNLNLLLFFGGGVAALALLGVPIMAAFGLPTLAYLAGVSQTPLLIAVGRIDAGMSGLILLSVPMFLLLGALVEASGMAAAMVRVLMALVGRRRGGLSYVLIGAMYLVSGISGSKAADMAAVAPALFPEMQRQGGDEGEMLALLSATGAMSETVPPSLVLIAIGAVTGVSIGALFTAGLLPAAVGALALAAVVWLRQRRLPPRAAAPAEILPWRALWWRALPALVLPLVIRAAVVNGVATATEVATVGIAYAVVLGQLFYRQLDWRRAYPMLVAAAALSGAILIIIGCATAMAWALTQSGFSAQLAALMLALPGGATGFLLVSVLLFVLLGSFLEGIPAIVLFAPLFFPVARQFGIHEVHYAIVAVFAMGLGLFAPPLGVGFYAACAIGGVSPVLAVRRVWPYLGALLLALLLVAACPWLSTGFLPPR
jgi:tripartite ATP-independent transporter DctM subunit